MYDILVIGGGPGGYAAAIRSSQLGGKTALVESGDVGGTCVNRGCIPAKIWMRAAYLLHQIRQAEAFGIKAAIETVDAKAIVARKDGVAAEIRNGMKFLLQNNGIHLVPGRAVLKNPREVDVSGQTLKAGKIILAMGSRPAAPDLPGLAEAVNSEQVLGLTQIPSSLLVWGEEYMAVEMAACLNVFGCRVTLATPAKRILPKEDRETRNRLTQALKAQGIEILTACRLEAVQKSDGRFVSTLSGSEQKTVKTAQVLLCSRRPNTTDMGLQTLGIALDENGFIRVNDRLETNIPGLYAIGDVTGGWMLSHAASAMGVTAAENATGQNNKFPFHLVPRGIWTFPQVGAVGLSEEEAKKQGYKVKVGGFPYSVNGLAMGRGEVEGGVKIVTEEGTGDVLGVHIVGAGAADLIGEGVMAMQFECSAEELAHSIRMHPTFSECIMDAGRDASGWALYLPKR
jgi:dihydrolipoamide dehydrogenase